MKHERIGVWINIEERLPEKSDYYFIVTKKGGKVCCLYNHIGQWMDGFSLLHGEPQYWLEPKQGVMVFTPQELKALINEAYTQGLNYGKYEDEYGAQECDEFLKSKGYE